jgi:hypothetical protein
MTNLGDVCESKVSGELTASPIVICSDTYANRPHPALRMRPAALCSWWRRGRVGLDCEHGDDFSGEWSSPKNVDPYDQIGNLNAVILLVFISAY